MLFYNHVDGTSRRHGEQWVCPMSYFCLAAYRRALPAREKVLGKEHPDILMSVDNLGWIGRQGRYEAEEMHRRALATRDKVLGKEHPDTRTSEDNLSWILERQSRR
jgi:hypothetical protein